jgi:hypothetical protein
MAGLGTGWEGYMSEWTMAGSLVGWIGDMITVS